MNYLYIILYCFAAIFYYFSLPGDKKDKDNP